MNHAVVATEKRIAYLESRLCVYIVQLRDALGDRDEAMTIKTIRYSKECFESDLRQEREKLRALMSAEALI